MVTIINYITVLDSERDCLRERLGRNRDLLFIEQPGIVRRLATGHLLQLFGISSSFHRDLGSSIINISQIVGREFD